MSGSDNPLGGETIVYPPREQPGATLGANGRDSDRQPIFTRPHPIGYEQTFATTPPAPKVLIPDILPCDVFGLVGPGGVAKTTFILWLMIRIILDRVMFGRTVNEPGPCLLISAEDNETTIRYRVNRLCDAMQLDEPEQRKVASDLHIEDVTGKMVRFVEVSRDGNLEFSDYPEEIIKAITALVRKIAPPTGYHLSGVFIINRWLVHIWPSLLRW